MDRYEHCMIEYYWSFAPGVDPAAFRPSFTVFHADGRKEPVEGGNSELTAYLGKLGAQGWRVSSGMTASNWILYTLERRVG